MSRDGIVRRSAVPLDLRANGPSGPVKMYWRPDSFTWYGAETRSRDRTSPYIRLNKTSISISNLAVNEAGFKPGDKLQVGINKGFLAIRKDESGMPARGESKKTKALRIHATKLLEKLKNEYPIPCRLICHWDAESQMLVGKWPEKGSNGQVAL